MKNLSHDELLDIFHKYEPFLEAPVQSGDLCSTSECESEVVKWIFLDKAKDFLYFSINTDLGITDDSSLEGSYYMKTDTTGLLVVDGTMAGKMEALGEIEYYRRYESSSLSIPGRDCPDDFIKLPLWSSKGYLPTLELIEWDQVKEMCFCEEGHAWGEEENQELIQKLMKDPDNFKKAPELLEAMEDEVENEKAGY